MYYWEKLLEKLGAARLPLVYEMRPPGPAVEMATKAQRGTISEG
jgi:hypothetical protein